MDPRATDTTEDSALAKYRILLELGEGGMANVYLAVARGPAAPHKLVVLKVLRDDLAQDKAFRTMALAEAKIAARVDHPNVVKTYEVLSEGEQPVIVMEYLEGQPLSNVVEETGDGTLTLAMSSRVLADALSGLHHVHELADYDGQPFGLVHRDFTPQNIFLGYDGHVKIIDFGIARTELAHGDETRAGTIKGKVRYMSPEQILGTPAVDRRADIFAAGMVLWELAAGDSPWKGESEIAIINHVINDELPSMPAVAPDVPPEIQRICMRATQFDRENRYATAAEMAADLEKVLSMMDEHVLPRDLGRVVCDHFREERATTQRGIEEQLGRPERANDARFLRASSVGRSSAPPAATARPPRLPPTTKAIKAAKAATKAAKAMKASTPVLERAAVRLLVRAILLVVTLAVVVELALLVRHRREDESERPSPAASPHRDGG